METMFSSSGQYNTNNMDTNELGENEKSFWVRQTRVTIMFDIL